ncbi:MAG: hypothetical protein QOC81_2362 [Thermoanaerobaculia bacterium]|jgi:hypothetical protein|nr:hypothetical protein [Thermoanaerobaculia bacterium]
MPTKKKAVAKKTSSDDLDDDLRPEYPAEFFRDMKPNRFAGMDLKFKGRPPIILDADVAEVFDSPQAVNTVLRSVIKAMRTASVGGKAKPAVKAASSPRIATKRRAS